MKNHIWNAVFLVVAIVAANFIWDAIERQKMKNRAAIAASVENQMAIEG